MRDEAGLAGLRSGELSPSAVRARTFYPPPPSLNRFGATFFARRLSLDDAVEAVELEALHDFWRVPLAGHQISTDSIAVASPRPISCRDGLPPKLLTEPTARWIARSPDGVFTTTLMRAP